MGLRITCWMWRRVVWGCIWLRWWLLWGWMGVGVCVCVYVCCYGWFQLRGNVVLFAEWLTCFLYVWMCSCMAELMCVCVFLRLTNYGVTVCVIMSDFRFGEFPGVFLVCLNGFLYGWVSVSVLLCLIARVFWFVCYCEWVECTFFPMSVWLSDFVYAWLTGCIM